MSGRTQSAPQLDRERFLRTRWRRNGHDEPREERTRRFLRRIG